MTFCTSCGKQTMGTEKFCQSCGAPQDTTEFVNQTPSPSPSPSPTNTVSSTTNSDTYTYKGYERPKGNFWTDPNESSNAIIILSILFPPFGFIMSLLLGFKHGQNMYGNKSALSKNCIVAALVGIALWAVLLA